MAQLFPESSVKPSSLTRTVVAGAIGNLLEWYDFGLIAYFATVIASQIMPPQKDRLVALVDTFGVFAAGFLVRPLGGVLFGYVGDRWGRKRALELSVLLMAVSTTLIGLLPPYASIGLAAPLLLTLMRLLQGLSVGGEYVGSMSFLSEHAAPTRRAFFGSWSSFSVVLGSLLGSGTAALLTGLLSEDQLRAWGWRVPFLSGVLIGLVGMWLRLGIAESPSFRHAQKTGKLTNNPLAETVRKDLGPIAITFGLSALLGVGYYLPFIWLPTWLSQINRPPLDENRALTANTIALAALLILTPLAALVADRVGRRPMILGTALGYVLLSYPLFLLMSGGTFVGALLAGLVFASCNSFFSGCMAATLVELFPTRTRYTGMALAYNVGMALLGGTAPLAATALIQQTDDVLAPAYYLIGAAALTGTAGLFVKSRHGQPLD
jgi:MFS transporter, MHS family, proline/betaine transporter